VILPDATIALDYMYALATRLASGMVVHADRMRENLDLTHGALFSQRVLLALVAAGRSRDEAYRITQELAQRAWDERTPLRDLLAARDDLGLDVDEIFDLRHYTRHAAEIVGRLDALVAPGAPVPAA
jgi:adenylosuccinate lyase